MESRRNMDLTSGPITGKLLVYVFPIIISLLVQQLYNAADAAVVGKFAGSLSLAAVGSTGPATSLIVNLFAGLSVGSNIICARLRGAGNQKDLERVMHASVVLGLLCGFGAGIMGFCLAKPMLRFMGLSETILGEASVYMRIYFLGSPASLLYNFSSGILRAHGNTRVPMIILIISGIVNVLLNLFFVIVLHMDSAGVAYATIISQLVSAVAVTYILFNPKGDYKMKFSRLKFYPEEFKNIIVRGVPCGINGIVFSLSNTILQSALFSFPDVIVSASSASNKVTNILYVIVGGFYTGSVSFAGQCSGRGDQKRIDQLLVRSLILSGGGLLLCAVLLALFPEQVLQLFSNDPEVISAAKVQMLVVAWAYPLYVFCEMPLGCLRGMGRTTSPTIGNILGICLPRLIWIWFIFPLNRTVPMLYSCYPVSYIIAGGIQIILYLVYRRRTPLKTA